MIPALAKQIRSTQQNLQMPSRLGAFASKEAPSAVRVSTKVSTPDSDASEGAKYYRRQASGGRRYYGRRSKGGWDYYGGRASGAAKYYGRRIKNGADYYGRDISGGWQYYREIASGAWQYHFGTSERYRTTPEDPWMDSNLRMDDGGPIDGPWYGHYLGPSPRTPREYDRHYGREPVTPVDAAAKRHDEEYDAIQNRYGMYNTYGDPAAVWFANYVHPHSGLHLALAYADAALVWRSWWGIGEGIFSGEYDLTFSKGTQGWANLFSDFAWALGITYLYAGPSAAWHLAVGLNPYVIVATIAIELNNRFDALGGIDYYSRRFGDGARYYGRSASGGWNYHTQSARDGWQYYSDAVSGGWSYYSDRFRNGWETSTGIEGGAKYYGSRISGGAKYYGGRISGGAKYYGGQISGGAKYYGGQISGGAKYYGGQISGGAKYYGGQISGGAKYYGGQISGGAKYYGSQISGGAKYYGGQASSGWKNAGGKVSDTWKKATGGGGGGGCFLTTAAVRSLSTQNGERVLATLRAFRDGCLLASDQGRELVGAYYAIAPQIVDRIDASSAPAGEYERIYHEIVLPCHQFILSGDSEAAIGIYSRGVCQLAAKWLSGDYR
ncbi:CFI-box-CTERM domain-containing protein [Lacipirellula sp.]|uniref:CFI-box-CTERM domain-containing protein n=1 Tax=Lacipirellula sp. TaxID=2691419 RepID=UPI003D0AE59B